MKHMGFINISSIQFFYNGEYDDMVATNEKQNKDINDSQNLEDSQEKTKNEDVIHIEGNNNNAKINMKCFDERDEDILIDSSSSTGVKSKTLDISSNTPEIPTGITDGVIAKIPVVLAQLVVPFNINSSIDLPEPALEIKDITNKLRLMECTLLQPTNILHIRGFIKKSIEYTAIDHSKFEAICGKNNNYTIDIPFECSTEVIFFTEPLDITSNTKEIFEYDDLNLGQNLSNEEYESVSIESSKFNQINEKFYNEIPYSKLLSSKVVELNEYIEVNSSKEIFMQIHESMIIELRIEILQNQPIVIFSAKNNITKS